VLPMAQKPSLTVWMHFFSLLQTSTVQPSPSSHHASSWHPQSCSSASQLPLQSPESVHWSSVVHASPSSQGSPARGEVMHWPATQEPALQASSNSEQSRGTPTQVPVASHWSVSVHGSLSSHCVEA